MKTHLFHAPLQPTPQTDFRLLLQSELARRCSGNPRYSLRALAMDLEIDHATLSQLVRQKRTLTPTMIERLGTRLKLSPNQIKGYVQTTSACPRCSDAAVDAARQLTHDAANLISDWYHYAILELVRLDDFQCDSHWIARVLGLSVDQVNLAISRLLHLDLLRMESPTRWVDASGPLVTSADAFTFVALQKLQLQLRELATQADARAQAGAHEHSQTTIALNTARLAEARALIARFRADMMRLLEQDQHRDDVYQLEINFFPLIDLQAPSDSGA